jgi:hypothetical protein
VTSPTSPTSSPAPSGPAGPTSPTATLRPAVFCERLLRALDAAEGRRRRRKRDQTPDGIGLGIKRDVLEAAVTADPDPADFEGWLLSQALEAPASGPVLAICTQIMEEYRAASVDPDFERWLAAGAPSDDADRGASTP